VDGRLLRAADDTKDQSYVLGVLTARQLAHALFPLGGSVKSGVRREAQRRGLAVADKPDSHDICFIADGDTAGFLQRRLGSEPGDIVDVEGRVVGQHDGAYAYTVGQRRGLRIGRPAPDGKPRYVLDVSPVTRTVTVGTAEELDVARLVGERAVWSGPPPAVPTPCRAQVRAHGEAVPAVAVTEGDGVVVDLGEPLRGVAPGQAVVLYDGDAVLGSATIAATSG
jgi:tRNA-specific 2-thiouridylase